MTSSKYFQFAYFLHSFLLFIKKIMVFISRNHTLCIYYQLKFNEENSIQALEKFQAISDEHEVCYLTDSTIPVFVLKARLYGSSFLFKEYFNEEVPKENVSNESVTKLDIILGVLSTLY
ncbi:uncharacterized protein RHIMIDRAFT_136772 [Rhizopus microsporus ATCC 52813]|uniref:Uncharacterized protein n=1 Tax=Rhizopus microsporus ATCC 52813 TaxID=1340429 RepID=A0A2G4SVK1_RHIZD|nr:uncharacterized protein RHIMIDRAFT_136772 [Rhizopus microsporus ATCC 52813]PHZ12762.1 hypothetical protein RHIMIDRAFT_136772 [Rhizopus microsporus ATCC 52813]